MRSTLVRVRALLFAGVAVVTTLVRAITIRSPLLRLEGGAATQGILTMSAIVQALPPLVLGVLVSGLIVALALKDSLSRIIPRFLLFAVLAVSVADMVLPGCECASMPVSQSLMRRGLSQGAALAFLLVTPAVNPMVLVAMAVTFASSNPTMVWARLIASLVVVIAVCWLWAGVGKTEWMELQKEHDRGHRSKAAVLRETAIHDLLQAGGFLAVGAVVAAFTKAVVPASFLAFLTENLWSGIVVMALLAVLLLLCSEVDALAAASLPGVPLTARLVLLVVRPMVDVKLLAMQSGALGARSATRFMSLTLFVCIWPAAVVGAMMFGTF